MKKTLTIVMTAATALLGLSSCNDSDSNSSPVGVAPISVADFTSGAKYFRASDNGVEFTLSGEESAENTDNNAQYANVILTMNFNGKNYKSPAVYMVEGSMVTISGITTWEGGDPTNMDEDFCKVWGLTLKKDETQYNLGSNPSFYIRISGGVARMVVTIPDSVSDREDTLATVTAPESPSTYTVQVETKQTSTDDSAGNGTDVTPTGN